MWDKPRALNLAANLLFALAGVLAAYSVLRVAVQLPVFALREVHVSGEIAHVTIEQVEEIVKRELSGNFFTLELAAARAAFEKLPWVRRANVRRHWPDRLAVALEEHVPLARWGTSGLVNTHGEVFSAAHDGATATGALPLFIGPAASAKEMAIQYEYFKRSLAAIGQVPLQVHLSPRRAWRLRLDSGLVVEVGREHIEFRVDRFVAVYARSVGRLQRKLEYVDLRYPNGFALRIPELRTKPLDRPRDGGTTKRG
jgi:cell division protein FtsQ